MNIDPQTLRELANRQALSLIAQVEPHWVDVYPAASALGLAERLLLHAGPPFADPSKPSAPILSSAVICCLYEGWASTEAEAEQLIRSGAVQLRPAQDFNLVTPLAAVASPSSTLVKIADPHSGDYCWSLLSSGAGPQIRFGSREQAILERLGYREEVLAPACQRLLTQQGIALIPLALTGILQGDDLHYQTTAATQALLVELESRQAESDLLELVQQTPLFFLTLWMAACRLMLSAASKGNLAEHSSLIVSLAGNGESLGACLSNAAARWLTMPAPAPVGPAGAESPCSVSPAVGDSGVIDAAGFGAQLWHRCADILSTMGNWYQGSSASSASLMSGVLPAFASVPVYSGLDWYRCQQRGEPVNIAIAMLDQAGQQGLIGRGIAAADLSQLCETAD